METLFFNGRFSCEKGRNPLKRGEFAFLNITKHVLPIIIISLTEEVSGLQKFFLVLNKIKITKELHNKYSIWLQNVEKLTVILILSYCNEYFHIASNSSIYYNIIYNLALLAMAVKTITVLPTRKIMPTCMYWTIIFANTVAHENQSSHIYIYLDLDLDLVMEKCTQ